jgi:hypothetical protein
MWARLQSPSLVSNTPPSSRFPVSRLDSPSLVSIPGFSSRFPSYRPPRSQECRSAERIDLPSSETAGRPNVSTSALTRIEVGSTSRPHRLQESKSAKRIDLPAHKNAGQLSVSTSPLTRMQVGRTCRPPRLQQCRSGRLGELAPCPAARRHLPGTALSVRSGRPGPIVRKNDDLAGATVLPGSFSIVFLFKDTMACYL